jgi:glycerol-3-phosphate acyltransferase PlsX
VALLSNGEEPNRGTPDVQAAHAMLRDGGGVRFAGNVEGTGLVAGAADVVVTDGFTGNVALKLMEGVSQKLTQAIRDRAQGSPRAAAGGLLLRPALRGLRDELDPEAAGGAYLLGLKRTIIVPHGRFTRHGFARAIAVAARAVEQRVVESTLEGLAAAGALRSRQASEPSSTVPSA